VADQFLAHGKADLRFERVERLDLETEQFVETELVLENADRAAVASRRACSSAERRGRGVLWIMVARF
jgi:hypothetical protein